MNYEKTCYSLIGSLIAGAIIQDNMDLSWPYLFAISMFLWAVCVGVQYHSFMRELRRRDKADGQKLERHNEEFERILTIMEKCSNQQVTSVKDGFEQLQGILIDNRNAIKVEIQKLMELINKIDGTNSESYQDIIRLISEVEKKYIELSNEQSDKICLKLKEHASLDKQYAKEFFDCIDGVVQSVISENKTNTESMIHEMGKLNEEIELIKILTDCISGGFKDLLYLISNCRTEVIENDTKHFDRLLEAENKNTEKNTELINLVRDKTETLNTYINESSRHQGDAIERLSEELRGIISNLQVAVDYSNQYLSNIERIEEQSFSMQEDTKNLLCEIRGEMQDCSDQISDRITEGIDKQADILSSEEEILLKYDDVLRRINDEVVVKMIADSNNMLKCMKDCYNLLESIRRIKK